VDLTTASAASTTSSGVSAYGQAPDVDTANEAAFVYTVYPRSVFALGHVPTIWSTLGNHDYIALWEQTNYRSSGARDAATTAESTIRTFASNNEACTYSDHSGNRGLIFATSPHARHALAVSGAAGAQLPTIGNIGLSAHSIGTAHDYVLTVFGLVTLWSIGMLLVWVIAGSALHGGLRAALALPVGCLAATVELAAYSLAGITWSVAWLLLPGLLFVLLLSWRFCAVLILALQKRSRPLDDGTPAGDHSRAGVESSVSR